MNRKSQTAQRNLMGLIGLTALGLVLLGIWITTQPDSKTESSQAIGGPPANELPHIHGLGFSSDGKQLIVPSHIGLAVFVDKHWERPDLPANDYMGYTSVDDGFYSSGHPGLQTELINPLGLVRSTDGGISVTTLGFAGETDFHTMAVGYQNHAIYVLNPAQNSKLAVGLHYSLDEGATWQTSAAQGLTDPVIQIAVHPIDASLIAVATESGLFISHDHGDTFDQMGDTTPVTAVSFHPDGEMLYFGYNTVFGYTLATEQVETFQTPDLGSDDVIGYIAAVQDKLAFATFSRDIYISEDQGDSWQQIAHQGKGIDL